VPGETPGFLRAETFEFVEESGHGLLDHVEHALKAGLAAVIGIGDAS
jgi:hypothetical protein